MNDAEQFESALEAAEDAAPVATVDDGFEDAEKAPDPKEAEKAKVEAEAAEGKKSHEAVERDLRETRRSLKALEEENRYFRKEFEKFKATGGEVKQPERKQPAADDDPEKFIVDLARKPKETLVKLLEDAGFVKKGEAAEMTRAEAIKILEEGRSEDRDRAKLYGEFKELADESSDFFKDTTAALKRSTGGDDSKITNELIRAAAMVAEAKAEAKSKGGSRLSREDRIAAQAPAGSGGRSEGGAKLSGMALEFAKHMKVKPSDAEHEFKLLGSRKRA